MQALRRDTQNFDEDDEDDDRYISVPDKEIKDEAFLEFFNIFLNTGELPNLFPRDELEAIARRGNAALCSASSSPATRRPSSHSSMCFCMPAIVRESVLGEHARELVVLRVAAREHGGGIGGHRCGRTRRRTRGTRR